MKKILPFLSLVGASLIITGCSNNLTTIKPTTAKENLNYLNSSIENMPNIENVIQTSVANKYSLTVDTPQTLELTEDNLVEEHNENSTEITPQIENTQEPLTDTPTTNNTNENEVNKNENQPSENEDIKKQEEYIIDNNTSNELRDISTLYSLSNDVENSCNEFCELKNEITNAILETEKLIEKIENNQITLTREERLTLNEQTMQLKNLGKQLSNITTHLAFNLSDLKQVLNENNADVNALSLKYLIVLDNLVNSNEMLQSGLVSLNLMNNLINNSGQARMIYGYQENNNPPIIKEYSINENGEISENLNNQNINEENKNIDTYNYNPMNANIDSYYSNNRKNIDSFFNTALLDNEFMYGNGGFYGGYGMNPYLNQYAQYERNQNLNSTNGIEDTNNTQDIENNNQSNIDADGEKIGNKERKKLQFKKNIDTYRDENTPDLKTRFNNFKENISNAFGKINPEKEIKHPIFKY